jgi:hypothetical protein
MINEMMIAEDSDEAQIRLADHSGRLIYFCSIKTSSIVARA